MDATDQKAKVGYFFTQQRTPINPTDHAYPQIHHVIFENVISPNAAGRPTPIPVSNMGETRIPDFNKVRAGQLPSASLIIRNLLRGNTG